ncbi:MAG: hypothetical protein AAFR81_21950, partial [Chloroflexota bacterium]
MSINLNEYYSGGYFLVRSGRPDWKPPFGKYLPDGNLISLSKCINYLRLSVLWGWTTGDRDAARSFGISRKNMDKFVSWCGTEYQSFMGYRSMFYRPEDARAFIRQFKIQKNNLYLLGAALPKTYQKTWIDEEDNNEGIAKRVKKGIAVDSTGKPIGFDVVSYSYSDFSHSWLCSGLEHEMNDLFGIRTNELGLLKSYDDAKKIYDWIAEDNYEGKRAEPEPYGF